MRRALAFVLLCACSFVSCRRHDDADDDGDPTDAAPLTSAAGYAADTGDHDGVDELGYGPRLAPQPVDTWKPGNLSLVDLLKDPSHGPSEPLVIVDVVETLHGFTKPSYGERGRYRVEAGAYSGVEVLVSPARKGRDRPGTVIAALPRDLRPPLRIIATVTRDLYEIEPTGGDREAVPAHAPWTLLVRSIAPLAFPAPETVASPDVLVGPDAARWDRHYVTATGPLFPAGDMAAFAHAVWIANVPGVSMRCPPLTVDGGLPLYGQVRVTGMAYVDSRVPGRPEATIVPTELQRIDPGQPGCR